MSASSISIARFFKILFSELENIKVIPTGICDEGVGLVAVNIRTKDSQNSNMCHCKNKCNFTPLVAAELPLISVQPFNCFKSYVLFDCIESDNA